MLDAYQPPHVKNVSVGSTYGATHTGTAILAPCFPFPARSPSQLGPAAGQMQPLWCCARGSLHLALLHRCRPQPSTTCEVVDCTKAKQQRWPGAGGSQRHCHSHRHAAASSSSSSNDDSNDDSAAAQPCRLCVLCAVATYTKLKVRCAVMFYLFYFFLSCIHSYKSEWSSSDLPRQVNVNKFRLSNMRALVVQICPNSSGDKP